MIYTCILITDIYNGLDKREEEFDGGGSRHDGGRHDGGAKMVVATKRGKNNNIAVAEKGEKESVLNVSVFAL